MVSESELIGRLREFLRNSDLNTTTTASVRPSTRKPRKIREIGREEVEEAQGEEDKKFNGKSEETEGSDSKEEQEHEDGEEEEIEHARNRKKKRGSNKLGNEVKKRGGGFCKLCSLSPQLQEFVGVPEMARTEVVKQLWAYIREKNLQDANNRRNIICDEPLHALFGVDSIDMFQMNKALAKHIWPLDSDNVAQVKSAPKEKQKQQSEEDPDVPKRKEKRQKTGKSGFLAPLQLSDTLVNFLGTGESALSRADVVKRMWDYIKQNNLQDPSDKRMIICDEKLKELFDVDSFHGFTVSKLLASHFVKTEQ
ncbi:upstream activation factor subunit spp27-like [Quillaja saponaria]|uniref:Upstream activation factor subunit spp27-like n=1 Tax=Quillaja saponaria TaxID=32244 RepID=A0AAD7PF84_QUISA|nr:upstream activation factor subunit spp27-like [Quillaja saponaria]